MAGAERPRVPVTGNGAVRLDPDGPESSVYSDSRHARRLVPDSYPINCSTARFPSPVASRQFW